MSIKQHSLTSNNNGGQPLYFVRGIKNAQQIAREITKHKEQTTGRRISCSTLCRWLHKNDLHVQRSVWCVQLTSVYQRLPFLLCQWNKKWTQLMWVEYSLRMKNDFVCRINLDVWNRLSNNITKTPVL